MNKKRVLLADNQALAAAGLEQILSRTEIFEIVAETADAAELEGLLENFKPDMLVLDYANLHNFSIPSFLNLMESRPFLRVLVVTADHKAQNILAILEAHVLGFITKNCSRQEILTAFQMVSSGQKFYCNRVLDVLMENKFQKSETETLLNKREIQIIEYISQGISTREMADRLNLSPHTVNAYRKNILKKMNVHSPVELVVKSFQTKIIQLPA